jgi:hypothetical protein
LISDRDVPVADSIEREATMSGKRRHDEREVKRKLSALARGVAVDPGALAPHGSYSRPDFVRRGYYVDQPFVCQACGVSQTWTAAQQKWWYEVAKGSLFSTAKLCRSCRRRESATETASLRDGDPNPYKSPRLLLSKIRSDIEPKLLSAGYRPVARKLPGERRAPFIDYSRSDDLFSVSWDRHEGRLAAELLTDGGTALRAIAAAEFSGVRSTSDIEDRLAPFMASVRSFLDSLCHPRPELESRTELSPPDNLTEA